MARKKNENGEELETWFEVFMRNYKNVPGFKAIVKLALWGILFIIIIVGANLSTESRKGNSNNPTQEISKKTYKDIIDQYKNELKVKITINNNVLVDATYKDSILSGTIETKTATSKFLIKDKKVYEIKMGEEKENSAVLKEYNIQYFIPDELIYILENNKSTKTIEDIITKYTYEMDNTNIIVNIVDEKINNILVKDNTIEYNIIYEI